MRQLQPKQRNKKTTTSNSFPLTDFMPTVNRLENNLTLNGHKSFHKRPKVSLWRVFCGQGFKSFSLKTCPSLNFKELKQMSAAASSSGYRRYCSQGPNTSWPGASESTFGSLLPSAGHMLNLHVDPGCTYVFVVVVCVHFRKKLHKK